MASSPTSLVTIFGGIFPGLKPFIFKFLEILFIASSLYSSRSLLSTFRSSSFSKSPITFRHIALKGEIGEISGHYHPKISINLSNAQITRACFIADQKRVIMPAYGTYTGGLSVRSDEIKVLFENDATVMLTGNKIRTVPYSSCF